MNPFPASNFFDLSQYTHKKIFDQVLFVWEALKILSIFLKNSSLGKIEGDVSPQAYLINPELISIGKGTVVEPGAYIKGPCFIGEECQIRHGAYIRGNVITGNHCVIGHDTEVKHSIFLNDAQAGHFAYIGDSILGNQCNLGAGTKLANLKFGRDSIIIRHQGSQINTEMKKFGAIIGDNTQTGCNSVTNPGTLLGKGVRIYPCVNIGGFVPSNHAVKNSYQPAILINQENL